jgi:SpoVK/Ycf46/Vps4 family AAA+-type ATPase/uncharacterized small protein (DUF1192 family)
MPATKKVRGKKPAQLVSYDLAYHNAVRVWMVRFFGVFKPTKEMVAGHRFAEDELQRILGVSHKPPETLVAILKEEIRTVKNALKKKTISTWTPVSEKMLLTQQVLKLSDTAREILHLLYCIHFIRELDVFFDSFPIDQSRISEVVAAMLALPEDDVQRELAPTSTLFLIGLIGENDDAGTLEDRLYVSKTFTRLCNQEMFSHETLQNLFMHKSRPAELELRNFPHVKREFEIACKIIKTVQINKTKGCNILVYGPPGVGKTELVRVIAKHLECDLWAVLTKSHARYGSGDPLDASDRIGNLGATQRLLEKQQSALILFDEVEEIFPVPSPFFGFGGINSDSKLGKGFLNELLETTTVPTIWVANKVAHIDDAHLRRFSLIIKIEHIPEAVRREIVDQNTAGLNLTCETRRWLTRCENISPALLVRATQSTRCATEPDEPADDIMRIVVENHLGAMSTTATVSTASAVTRFDPRYTNFSLGNVESFLTSIARSRQGRVLFYGAPGTGKTQLAQEMARRLQRTPLVKRASDLLSCYVGESEQNISALFARCARTKEFLILDEADSFLTSRERAMHSWEVTRVNEMLTQIEAYNGWLAFTTNLMGNIDEASLRRFDIKAEFLPMSSEQVALMIQEEMLDGVLPAGTHFEGVRERVSSLRTCTPGDFAAIKRRQDVRGIDPKNEPGYLEWLIQQLTEEQAVKRNAAGSKSIGFGS